MKYRDLRFKILFIIMTISLFSVVSVGLYSYDVQQKLLYKVSNEKLMIMMKVIKKSEKERYRRYNSYLLFTTKDEKFLSDLITQDIKSVEKYLAKKNSTFRAADKSFEHLHLYDAKGNAFNITIEDKFENHLEENVVLNQAMRDAKVSKGYVLYDKGYYYSVVMPVFKDSVAIAYLEVGIKADSNIRLAAKVGRYKFALYINNHDPLSKKVELDEPIISNSTLFESLNLNQEYIYKYANQNIIIKNESNYYLLNQYDIETPYQKNFAQNILANNVTSFVLQNRERVFMYSVFSVIVLILMYVIMYIYISKLIAKLLKDEDKLLAQKDEIQLVMDNNDNFILVYENSTLTFANKPFLYFFNTNSLESFIENYKSIELLFEDVEGAFVCKYAPNSKWMEEIESLPIKERVIAMEHSGSPHFFNVKISKMRDRENLKIISFSEVTALFQGAKKDQYDARHDTLTKIYNRKYFNEVLSKEISRAEDSFSTFTLIMLDIDHFKAVNDTYGHQVGDDVLVNLAKVVTSNIRSRDLFARWGGEEFVLLLSGASERSAINIAQNLRLKIEQEEFNLVGRVTCSLGVSEYIVGDTLISLMSRVDEALYVAKENGRNRVEVN